MVRSERMDDGMPFYPAGGAAEARTPVDVAPTRAQIAIGETLSGAPGAITQFLALEQFHVGGHTRGRVVPGSGFTCFGMNHLGCQAYTTAAGSEIT